MNQSSYEMHPSSLEPLLQGMKRKAGELESDDLYIRFHSSTVTAESSDFTLQLVETPALSTSRPPNERTPPSLPAPVSIDQDDSLGGVVMTSYSNGILTMGVSSSIPHQRSSASNALTQRSSRVDGGVKLTCMNRDCTFTCDSHTALSEHRMTSHGGSSRSDGGPVVTMMRRSQDGIEGETSSSVVKERLYCVHEGCSYSTQWKSDMTRHKKKHTGEVSRCGRIMKWNIWSRVLSHILTYLL